MHLVGVDRLSYEWEAYRIAALCVLWSFYWTYLLLSKRIQFSVLSLMALVSGFAVIFGSFALNRYRDGLPE